MPPTNTYVISYHTLRQLIGILGIALPFLCWGVNGFVNENDLLNNAAFVNKDYSCHYEAGANLKSSISHFYYTTAGPLFTGILIHWLFFSFAIRAIPKRKQRTSLPGLQIPGFQDLLPSVRC